MYALEARDQVKTMVSITHSALNGHPEVEERRGTDLHSVVVFLLLNCKNKILIGCFNRIVVTMVADKLERQLASSYYNHNKMQPLYG